MTNWFLSLFKKWEKVETVEVDGFLLMEFSYMRLSKKLPENHRWIMVKDDTYPSGAGWLNGKQTWEVQKLAQ